MINRLTRIICMIVGMAMTLPYLVACDAKEISQVKANHVKVQMTTVEVWTNNASSKTEDVKMVYDFNHGAGREKGIFIDYQIMGGEYIATLQAAMAANQAPVLFKSSVSTSSIPRLAKEGWIVAIEDIAGGKEFLQKYQGYLQPINNIYNGKTYTVPFAVTTLAVAYNKDLLKKNRYTKPPETWAELREMAKTITKNGGGRDFGFIEGFKSNIHAQNGLLQFVPSVGHDEFDPKTGKFSFITFAPFYQLWVDMKKDGSIFPGCENLNNDQARAQFAEGNIGFKFSASYDVGVWNDQLPTKMDWGICRPVVDPEKKYKSHTYQTPSLVFGRKALEIPEKAMEVFKLWNADETLVKLYEAGKYIPYNQDIIKVAKVRSTIKNWTDFSDINNTYLTMPNLASEISLEGENVPGVIQKIIGGTISVEEGLADLDKRHNMALDKAVSEGFNLAPYINSNYDISIRK